MSITEIIKSKLVTAGIEEKSIDAFGLNYFTYLFAENPILHLIPEEGHEKFFEGIADRSYSYRYLRLETERRFVQSLSAYMMTVDDMRRHFLSTKASEEFDLPDFLLGDNELESSQEMEAIMRRAQKSAEDSNHLEGASSDGWMGDGEISLASVNVETLRQMVAVMTSVQKDEFRGILSLVGRADLSLKIAKQGAMSKLIRSTPHSFCLGAEIADILPSEYATKKMLRLKWLADFAEGNLLQDEFQDTVHSEGDFIILGDESGSMGLFVNGSTGSNPDGLPQRITWQRAISYSLTKHANSLGRKVRYLPFGDGTRFNCEVSINELLTKKYLRAASTNISKSIHDVVKDWTNQCEPFGLNPHETDIVAITDGDDELLTLRSVSRPNERLAKIADHTEEFGVRIIIVSLAKVSSEAVRRYKNIRLIEVDPALGFSAISQAIIGGNDE